MTTGSPTPENVRLRYQVVSIFEHADTSSNEMAKLQSDDRFSVLGSEGEFYRVRLVDGTVGFIFAHNLVGSHMPLTATEQRTADERAAREAMPPGGWRGLLQRVSHRPQRRPE